MSRVEWCDKPVSEVRCRLEPGHDGLCCTGMEASLVVKCEHLRAECERLTREREDYREKRANEMESLRASLATAERALAEVKADFYVSEQAWLQSAPHHDPAQCPTYYDGCHCTVTTLAHNIERADAAESSLAAARDVLREVGFIVNVTGQKACRVCFKFAPDHDADCALASALGGGRG